MKTDNYYVVISVIFGVFIGLFAVIFTSSKPIIITVLGVFLLFGIISTIFGFLFYNNIKHNELDRNEVKREYLVTAGLSSAVMWGSIFLLILLIFIIPIFEINITHPIDNTKISDNKVELFGTIRGNPPQDTPFLWIVTSTNRNKDFYPQHRILDSNGQWTGTAYVTSPNTPIFISILALDEEGHKKAQSIIDNYSPDSHLEDFDPPNLVNVLASVEVVLIEEGPSYFASISYPKEGAQFSINGGLISGFHENLPKDKHLVIFAAMGEGWYPSPEIKLNDDAWKVDIIDPVDCNWVNEPLTYELYLVNQTVYNEVTRLRNQWEDPVNPKWEPLLFVPGEKMDDLKIVFIDNRENC